MFKMIMLNSEICIVASLKSLKMILHFLYDRDIMNVDKMILICHNIHVNYYNGGINVKEF